MDLGIQPRAHKMQFQAPRLTQRVSWGCGPRTAHTWGWLGLMWRGDREGLAEKDA